MKKNKILIVFVGCFFSFFPKEILATEASENIDVNDTQIEIIHNPTYDEFREKILPVYQSYYQQKEGKSLEDILEGYKRVNQLPGFHLIAAFDEKSQSCIGFINFSHAACQFYAPEYPYRTLIDSVYVKPGYNELKVYDSLFKEAEKISREVKSDSMIVMVGTKFPQEKRLYSSNLDNQSTSLSGETFFSYSLK